MNFVKNMWRLLSKTRAVKSVSSAWEVTLNSCRGYFLGQLSIRWDMYVRQRERQRDTVSMNACLRDLTVLVKSSLMVWTTRWRFSAAASSFSPVWLTEPFSLADSGPGIISGAGVMPGIAWAQPISSADMRLWKKPAESGHSKDDNRWLRKILWSGGMTDGMGTWLELPTPGTLATSLVMGLTPWPTTETLMQQHPEQTSMCYPPALAQCHSPATAQILYGLSHFD